MALRRERQTDRFAGKPDRPSLIDCWFYGASGFVRNEQPDCDYFGDIAIVQGVVAITGGTGFVGGHVVTALIDAGYGVRMLARDPSKVSHEGDAAEAVEVISGSLDDVAALERLCEGATCMVHCAGAISARDRVAFDDVNVTGTRNVVDACIKAGVGKLVLVSSVAAREPGLSDYGASKRAGETVVRETSDRVSWSIIRPPAVYGPGDKGTLPLIRQLTGRIAVLPGNGNNRFSLIFVKDLADSIVALVEPAVAVGEIHEVHDGAIGGYSWQALAHAAGKVNGRKVSCIFVPQFLLAFVGWVVLLVSRFTGQIPAITPGKVRELYHYDWVCKARLLDEATEWQPKVEFESGYDQAVQWYREHGWL